MDTLADRLDDLAGDIGRLRRWLQARDYATHLVDRLADTAETMDCMLQPSAGELVKDGDSVDDALATIDGRTARFRALLGCS